LYFDSFHVWSEVAVHLVTARVRWVHAMNESNGCRVQGRVRVGGEHVHASFSQSIIWGFSNLIWPSVMVEQYLRKKQY
jgi:hypothetical protein